MAICHPGEAAPALVSRWLDMTGVMLGLGQTACHLPREEASCFLSDPHP